MLIPSVGGSGVYIHRRLPDNIENISPDYDLYPELENGPPPEKWLPDDEYRKLQLALVLRPETGKIILGSGGLRKIRWKSGGSGKRGGFRLIYFWDVPKDTIYMLLIYKKSKQEDLTQNQLKTLRNLVKELLK